MLTNKREFESGFPGRCLTPLSPSSGERVGCGVGYNVGKDKDEMLNISG
jgi:hypothetical protein